MHEKGNTRRVLGNTRGFRKECVGNIRGILREYQGNPWRIQIARKNRSRCSIGFVMDLLVPILNILVLRSNPLRGLA